MEESGFLSLTSVSGDNPGTEATCAVAVLVAVVGPGPETDIKRKEAVVRSNTMNLESSVAGDRRQT